MACFLTLRKIISTAPANFGVSPKNSNSLHRIKGLLVLDFLPLGCLGGFLGLSSLFKLHGSTSSTL